MANRDARKIVLMGQLEEALWKRPSDQLEQILYSLENSSLRPSTINPSLRSLTPGPSTASGTVAAGSSTSALVPRLPLAPGAGTLPSLSVAPQIGTVQRVSGKGKKRRVDSSSTPSTSTNGGGGGPTPGVVADSRPAESVLPRMKPGFCHPLPPVEPFPSPPNHYLTGLPQSWSEFLGVNTRGPPNMTWEEAVCQTCGTTTCSMLYCYYPRGQWSFYQR